MENSKRVSFFKEYSLYLAWVTALIAVSGSLYFSEIAGYIPCKLCWFQRIFMYPLAIILGISSYKRDKHIIPYALSLSMTGGVISFYHYLEQKTPWLSGVSLCGEGVPCSGEYINWLSFITIPFLALTAFTIISFLLWMGRSPKHL